ncbi:MAG: trypsin-like peptidase domain-containing protein [Candidatus Sumerlaeia bacterium]|nr:trypsin-like peptidase domain-containing protein [Candidatus Sumerlaeia bacterium]
MVAIGTIEQGVVGMQRGHMLIDAEVVPLAIPYLGSGVIIDGGRGLILTNDHVIRGLRRFLVSLPDGRQFEAEYVGGDRNNDLALLRVAERGLPDIPLGRSDDLMVGEWALAIGNPFGNYIDDPEPTVTVGVISALHRDLRDQSTGRVYLDMIQTDASINPGNSGGALVNAHGELIGINTFIISTSGSSADIGFAIPVDRIHRVVDDILEHGSVRPIYVDFHSRPYQRWMAERQDQRWSPGAIVWEIDMNGPAARAGLRNGDVITQVNGERITSSEELELYLFTLRVGEPIQLTVRRGGDEQVIEYTLVEDRR